jgi:hypothetical protein
MSERGTNEAELDDFDRVIGSLIKNDVDFMIIGGYAVIFHGNVRTTKDLDILIRRTPENAKRTVAALEQIGLTCPELSPEFFMSGKGITFGEPPMRVDVLSEVRGVNFDDAWTRRQTSRFGPHEANYIGLDDLVRNKEAVGRPQDLVDAQRLRLAQERSLGAPHEKQVEGDEGPDL